MKFKYLDIKFLHRYVDAATNLRRHSISFDGVIPSIHQNYWQFYLGFCQHHVELQNYLFFPGFFFKLLLDRYPFSLKTFSKCLADPRNKLCIGSTIFMPMVWKYSKYTSTEILVLYPDSSLFCAWAVLQVIISFVLYVLQ